VSSLDALRVAIEAIGIAGAVAVAYASTNIDNFLVLSAYSAKSAYRPFYIKLTFVLVCLIVILVSLGLARAADEIIAGRLRYLGAIPVAIGLYHLGKLVFRRVGTEDGGRGDEPGRAGWSIYLGFGLALLANSSDSVIILAPILAELKLLFVVACTIGATAVALAMSGFATFVVGHPILRVRIEKIAEWALPVLLIGIGAMILSDRPKDAFIEAARSTSAVVELEAVA